MNPGHFLTRRSRDPQGVRPHRSRRGRRGLRGWLGEALERRELLAGELGRFAVIQGVLAGAAEVVPLSVRRGMFESRTGRVLVDFDVAAASEGAVSLGRIERQVGGQAVGSPLLRRVSADRLLVGLGRGSFGLGVEADGPAAPAGSGPFFALDARLVGDVNGDFLVGRKDLRRIRELQGVRAGDARFDPAADVTGDGRINYRDRNWTVANLGARTSLRPLGFRVDIAPEFDPDGDNHVTHPEVHVVGATGPGATARLDLGADGSHEAVGQADAEGSVRFAVPLPDTDHRVRLTATDAFGQRASRLLTIRRAAAVPQAGLALQSAGPLQGYQEFVGTARRTTTVENADKDVFTVEAWTYAVPGVNPLDPNTPNINLPYIVNGSATFDQPAQSTDWWTNLMFRQDPATVTNPLPPNQTISVDYANAPMYTEPAIVQLLDGGRAKGVSIFNPTRTFVTTTPDAANPAPFATLTNTNYNPGVTVQVDGIQPVVQTGTSPTVLNARVNRYSDWGVQIAYGNATDTMTVDMLSGSPFVYFQKSGPSPLRFAVEGSQPEGVTQPAISTFDVGDPNVVGLRVNTVVTSSVDGNLRAPQVAYYLVMARTATPGATWTLAESDGNQTFAIYQNNMQDGQVVVALLPAQVGGVDIDQLAPAQLQAVAAYFQAYAFNVPTDTALSDPRTAYDPAASTVTSTMTVTTANAQPTLQVLLPHQWRNLVAGDRPRLDHGLAGFDPGLDPLELTYVSPRGVSKLYLGNSFTTRLAYRGVLPYLPTAGVVSDPASAGALFQGLSDWFQARYGVPLTYQTAPNPDAYVQPDGNSYEPSLTRQTETIRLADALAQPGSALAPAQRALMARLRDYILASLKAQLMTWFDIGTGKLFHLNTTYNSTIGYTAGFGSDYQLNDHHFHYGYIVSAFAAIAPFEPDFVRAYQSGLDAIVRDVANFDRTRTDLPFFRNFNQWSGHSWADGLGRGGNNQESSSEAMNFAAGLMLLGEAVDNPDWRNVGAFLYTTEAESIHQYWFNSDAWAGGSFDPAASNWPAAFAQLQTGLIDGVTQVANVAQQNISESLFFGATVDGRYAINWLPVLAQSLYLATNPGYLTANWKQFLHDYNANQVDGKGNYELVVAAYQALVPPDGTTGVSAPGPDGALARINAHVGVDDSYAGLTKPVALAWVLALKALGQYDPTISADTPHAAVFRTAGGQPTYLVFVPNTPVNPTTMVTFRDAGGNVVATKPVSGPGLYTFQGAGTTPQVQQFQPTPRIDEPLFLRSDPAGSGLSLSPQAGTAVPDTSQVYPAPTLAPYQQPGSFTTFVEIPARTAADGNSVNPPASLQNILTFDTGPIQATYSAAVNGGETRFELWLNQFLEPGILWNLQAANHLMVMRVYYNPVGGPDQRPGDPGPGVADRIEEYRFVLGSTNRYNALTEDNGSPYQIFPLNDTPFPQTLTGLRIEIWAGTYDDQTAEWSNRAVALSVNTPASVGRASRIGVPYEFGG